VLLSRGPSGIVIDHNTAFQTGKIVSIDNGQSSGFVCRNNLVRHNKYGIFGTGSTTGLPTLKKYFPNYVVDRNVFAGGSSSLYPPDNFFPTMTQFYQQFSNYGAGNYQLVSWSPYIGLGTDGLNLGANITSLQAVLQGGTTAAASTMSATISTATATTLASETTANQTTSASSTAGDGGGDIVLTAADVERVRGNWTITSSSGSPENKAIQSANKGWQNTSAPLARPVNYVDVPFQPSANTSYRVWLRMKSASAHGDSVWLQFTGAVSSSGRPLWRIGSTQGWPVKGEACDGCQVSGWGWHDSSWWLGVPPLVRFESGAPQTLRIQTREDGVSIDEIVLSPATYLSDAPGASANDGIVLPRSAVPLSKSADVVLRTADAVRRSGNWTIEPDGTAADGVSLASADRGWSTVSAPLTEPRDYVDMTFTAVAGVPYRTWLRMSATANDPANDSVWVQYDGSLAASGGAAARIGSTTGIVVNRQPCSGCTISGWAWRDSSWWTAPGTVVFEETGVQTIRIQVREDGVRFDQIVISPQQYVTRAPGAKNADTTIVPR
jgi:hypothetical protein